MRIGIDARLYRSSTAGIGRYSQNLIKNLLEIDHDNQFVLFMTPADRQEFKSQISNLKIVEVNIPHYSLAEQTKLAGIIEKEKCDLIHFLNFNHPVRYRGKFIVTIHDLTLLFYPEAAKKTNLIKKFGFKYAMKKACQNASRIIAVSENTKRDIIKTFNIDSEKITVIYEAADDKLEKIRNPKPALPAGRSEIRNKSKIKESIILYVGQYRKHKNIEGLLKAYKILKKKQNIKLALVGKIPENYQNIIDNDPDLRDTLRPGFVLDEELTAWYNIADVFVYPSLYEGFGLPGLEAMMAGVPVVASNKSSLPEIYQDGALYFDPLKPEEIADKIEIVLANKKLSAEMIEKGKKQAAKYSWEKTASDTLKVYQEVQKSKIKNQSDSVKFKII